LGGWLRPNSEKRRWVPHPYGFQGAGWVFYLICRFWILPAPACGRQGKQASLLLGFSLLSDHDRRRGESGAELAGGEGFQGAQAGFELGGGYAAQAVEGVQKIFGGSFSFLRVAFDAAGNEIAVGIAASAGVRDDMVEDSTTGDEPPQAIKAPAALAHMNGLAAAAHLQEIHLLEIAGAEPPAEAGGHGAFGRLGVYLLRQKDFGQVASLGAVDQAQSAFGGETAHGLASGLVREVNTAGEAGNRKTELALACESAMPQKMGVDHALRKIEAQARHEIIFEPFPKKFGVRFIVFHGLGSKVKLTVDS
jgi:hypothetical protein